MIKHLTKKPVNFCKDTNDKVNIIKERELKIIESNPPILKNIQIETIKNNEMNLFYYDGFLPKIVKFNDNFVSNMVSFCDQLTATTNNLNASTFITEKELPQDINLRKYIDDNFNSVLNECFKNGYNLNFMYHNADEKKLKFNFNKKDLDHVTFSHVDTTGPMLKIMLYLTDHDEITQDNGCFQVIPGSHLKNYENDYNTHLATIRAVNEKGFMTNYKEFYEQLDEINQKKNMFMLNYNKNDEYYQYIKQHLKPLTTPNTMILFCPDIIHTGGYIYKGTRKALHICLSSK
jgi:hypothetical protein